MIQTFVALLLAHALADFVLQTSAMVRTKARPGTLLLHGLVVLITAQLALGHVARVELLGLALVHVAIDIAKLRLGGHDARGFLLDQAAHLATLAALACYAPGLWATGFWVMGFATYTTALPALMAIAAGAIIAIRGGQFAVGHLMAPYRHRIRNAGLRDGGRLIGVLERGLIFALILIGQPIGVGFLIAAKSILRFGTASKDQRTAEYVIIGTLASFGWAILTAYATQRILALLL